MQINVWYHSVVFSGFFIFKCNGISYSHIKRIYQPPLFGIHLWSYLSENELYSGKLLERFQCTLDQNEKFACEIGKQKRCRISFITLVVSNKSPSLFSDSVNIMKIVIIYCTVDLQYLYRVTENFLTISNFRDI